LSLILWFLALVSSRPEIQARAHAELDSVVGRDGWPGAEEEQHLPYIRAIIKEVRYETSAIYLSLSQSQSVSLGGADPRAVLDTTATLFDGRLCIQRDVHPEEHGGHPQLLWNTS
jgi:hypothetical protein